MKFRNLIFCFFVACTAKQKNSSSQNASIKEITEQRDSLIQVSLFDLTKLRVSQKEYLQVQKAAKQSMDNDLASNFLSWADPNDFYILDIDSDGDSDIIYSSLVGQYKNTDMNAVYIFQNCGLSPYKRVSIPGYVYDTDLFETSGDSVLIKTVRRPCCDNSEFVFFSTFFNRKNWTLKTRKVMKMDKTKVRETI
jgi:hypothetical protein